MDLLRALAILIEVIILTGIVGCLLSGLWLTLFDLGLGVKYQRFLAVVLTLAGAIVVVFFIAHLASFYPTP